MCLGLGYNATSFPNIWLAIPDQAGAAEVLQDYQVSCWAAGGCSAPCCAHCSPTRSQELLQVPMLFGCLFGCHHTVPDK